MDSGVVAWSSKSSASRRRRSSPTVRRASAPAWRAATATHAAVAAAVAAHEPVTVVAAPVDFAAARAECGPHIDVVAVPIDDSWVRDTGPIGVVGPGADRAFVDFEFNGWGQKYAPWAEDD